MAVEGFVGPGNESGIEATPKRSGHTDIVVAVFGSGRMDARLRGQEPVVASAMTIVDLYLKLGEKYPEGFIAEFRDDPHM